MSEEHQPIEFENIENFSNEEKQFSHQTLVMKCLNKAIDAGCVEMKEGKTEIKRDRLGNQLTIYIPDTRRTFIECVKTTKSIMACDFDEEAETKILSLLSHIKTLKQRWWNAELQWWNGLKQSQQRDQEERGVYVRQGFHCQKLEYKDHSLYEEVEIWRDILEELNKLTKRLGYYESDKFEG